MTNWLFISNRSSFQKNKFLFLFSLVNIADKCLTVLKFGFILFSYKGLCGCVVNLMHIGSYFYQYLHMRIFTSRDVKETEKSVKYLPTAWCDCTE